jgi:hypothetical protein
MRSGMRRRSEKNTGWRNTRKRNSGSSSIKIGKYIYEEEKAW